MTNVATATGSTAAAPKRRVRSAGPAKSSKKQASAEAPLVSGQDGLPEPRIDTEEIARLAYFLWESRGRQGGDPAEDWIRAERELRERAISGKR